MPDVNGQAHVAIPWHRNPVVRAWTAQILLIAFTLWAVLTIYGNTVTNLAERGIKTGFLFMDTVAPFAIPLNFSPFWEYTLGESMYWEVLIIGIQNTLIISLIGIPSATFLGLIIGIARLSPNWLIRKLSGAYVECFRNTPLLLQLMFWGFAIFPLLKEMLPPVNSSIFLTGGTVINNAGIFLPLPVFDAVGALLFGGVIATGLAACWLTVRWAKKRQDTEGKQFPIMSACLILLVVAAIAGFWLAGDNYHLDLPVKKGLNYRGGMRPPFQLLILWFGLTVYTAAFIAENVRGGLLAVQHGQTEAGMALGLQRMQRLRLVILPQAMRVIIPPTISQFLNLTKNSSLAVAIGYPDITNIWAGIALNQTGQSLIIIAITLLVYECLSLLTSALLNWYNKRVMITER